MPLYEYECRECGELFEQWRRITDEDMPECPHCGSLKTRKRISLSSFHLKGSGWYVTDYGRKHNGSSLPKESGDHPDSSKKSNEGAHGVDKGFEADEKSSWSKKADKEAFASAK